LNRSFLAQKGGTLVPFWLTLSERVRMTILPGMWISDCDWNEGMEIGRWWV